MSKFYWSGLHPFFYHPFISSFTPDLKKKVIVDCGCGKGIMGYLIRATRDLNESSLMGIDINAANLSFCQEHRVYDKLLKHSLPTLPLKDKSVDFLMCTEVIEHLTKKEGLKLLSEIDRVCKGRVIVTTPNIFFKNPPGEKGDVHRSTWSASDFSKYGYRVYGLGLRMPILVSDPFLKIKQALYYFFTPVSYFIPEIGGFLLCVKDHG